MRGLYAHNVFGNMKTTEEILTEIERKINKFKELRHCAVYQGASIQALKYGEVILQLLQLKHWIEQEN